MKKLPNREEIKDMRFSSLACRVHDWIHSSMRSVITGSQKSECVAAIKLLEEKLQIEPENTQRVRVVTRLKKDLEGMTTYAMATRKKDVVRGR